MGPAAPKTPNTRGGGHGFREEQRGPKEKGRKRAFPEIDRDREVEGAGKRETRLKETEMGIGRGQVETERIDPSLRPFRVVSPQTGPSDTL